MIGLAFAVSIGGCSSGNDGPQIQSSAGLGCVDDSRHCIEQRQASLRAMMADREKRWIREPASPSAYASGVRLFAFKSRKRDLTCDELAQGRREADAGPAILRGPGGAGLTPAQISRGAMLSAEVSKELNAEMQQRRCRA
ncbi:MAG: hypothetical protein ACKVP7_17965 [Hyphomicrobiaceae bacterium]